MVVAVELWRDVPNYEDAYQVSNLGRVRSLPGGRRHGKVLRPAPSGRGYPAVALCAGAGIKPKNHYVHHLVALAFIGPRPEGLDVCHTNGDMSDNRVENLRYDDVSGNMRDAVRHGTHRGAAMTACIHGHEYTLENTALRPDGFYSNGEQKLRRRCRICERDIAARNR